MNEPQTPSTAASPVGNPDRPSVSDPAPSDEIALLRRRVDELEGALAAAQAKCQDYERELEAVKKAPSEAQGSAVACRDFLDSLPQAVFETEADGRVIYANPSAFAMFGFEPEEPAKGIHVFELLAPAERERALKRFREFMAGEQGAPREYQAQRRNGQLFPVLIHSVPIWSQGRVAGIRGILVDISERKRVETELRQSEERFRAIIQSSLDIIVLLDGDDKIAFESPSASHLLGYAPGYLVGKSPLVMTHPEDRALIEEKLRETHNGTRTGIPVRFRCQRADGAWVHLEAIATNQLANPAIGGIVVVVRDITERKNAEEALRQSEAVLAGLFASTPAGVGLLVNRVFQKVNAAMCRITGYTEAELLGSSTRMLHVDEQVFEQVGRKFYEQNEAKPHLVVEIQLRRKDGSVMDALVGMSPLDRSDWHHAVVSTVLDITDRKQAEQALRDSEERLQSITSAALDAIVMMDDQGRVSFWNQAAERLFGYSREAALGQDLHRFLAPERMKDAYQPGLRRFLATGQGSVLGRMLELTAIHRDGHELPVELSVASVQLGGKFQAVGIIRDISERKRAEEALARAQALLMAAVVHSPAGIVIVDAPDGLIRLVNPAALAIRGETSQWLTGIPIALHSERWQTYWPDGRPVAPEDLPLSRAVLRGETTTNVEVQIRRSDGETRCVLANAAPVRNSRGEIIAAIAVFPDITELRRAEAAKAKLEEHLRQSQKLEAIGTLAGGIAHDFNNILGAMMSFAELARRRTQDNAEVQDYLGNVLKACDRAKDLVRQILSFSRQQKQERVPLAIQIVIKEALKLLRSTLPASIEMSEQIPSQLPQVLADPTQIHQVLVNLCTNAVHAMRHQRGRLKVRVDPLQADEAFVTSHPDLRPGRYVRLQVSDDGHGMDEATQKHIFEPFFTTKGPGEGTGLGLSVVHGIVREHDGAIYVQSQPGQGSVFDLFFPALPTVEEAAPEERSHLPPGNQERILVVDDEAALCAAVSRMLRHLGYQPTSSTDPRQALALFCEHLDQFDLVITDLSMPGMTGIDLAAGLLALRPEVPVLLTSGFSGTVTPEMVHKLGIRELVPKPITLSQLGTVVHQVLAASKSAAHGHGHNTK